jgi:methionyl-tRNA formyltransferase
MRIAFMGTPNFAVPTLDALAAAGHEIVAVYTQPPRPAGRGKALAPSPVQKRAEALGLAVRHPATLRDAGEQAALAALDLDVAVVAAYGLILPMPILEAPRLGCLNVHGSLLPRWRGAAPVQRAILAGDVETGVTIMQMEKGLDTGPMRLKGHARIDSKTAGALTDELAALGAQLMVRVLADPDAYPKSAASVERQVRAFNPAPGAFFEFAGERIQILAVVIENVEGVGEPGEVMDDRLCIACGVGAVRALVAKRAGRGAMPAPELLRGFPIAAGTRLA